MTAAAHEVTLTGLNGSSLMGFMAALGTLKTLDLTPATSEVKMKWVKTGSSFCPVLRLPVTVNDDAMVATLDGTLRAFANHDTVTFADDLKVTEKQFRPLADSQAKNYLADQDTLGAAVAAAYGCDAVLNDDGNIEDTAFRTMSGAGHQHFLQFMNELAKNTSIAQLREALFGPWQYRDPSPIMRWDDEDDRRYALRWDEPSKDPVRTVRGANRLAVAALPLFPVVPVSSSAIATTSFRGKRSHDTFITWPLWSGWLGIDTLSSLLSLRELQSPDVTATQLHPLGVCAVYRSQRITLGKYRNFTPAKSV